jgi:2-C-methyl-D-erythritol 4-phosphate cytidylyltransferase/2-C-methyl-D-erythritol 2,4-cyclodiphosphate synthase
MPDPAPRTLLLIPAAGTGTRVGPGRPKTYREIGGTEVLRVTLDGWARVPGIVACVIAVHPEWRDHAQSLVDQAPLPFKVVFTDGGATRGESVRAAWRAGDAQVPDCACVAIHDAARPFVDGTVAARTIESAIANGAALAARKCAATVHRVDAVGSVVETPDRTPLVLAGTPQCFRTDAWRSVVKAVVDPDRYTDEIAQAAVAGIGARWIEDVALNFKITDAADLALADLIARHGLAQTP